MMVKILYTLRKPELAEYSDLVFKTLRTGFPTAKITVFLNGTVPSSSAVKLIKDCQCRTVAINKQTIHHDWISHLMGCYVEPFWICDTDMIFWESVEGWKFDQPLAGRRIPQWLDEFTNCITRPRLHTSLLYIDPNGVIDRLHKYLYQFPSTPFNPFTNMINPLCVPVKGKTYFYDTTAMLYNAIGGQPFTERQLDAFDHLNFGTISDIVLPRLMDGERMRTMREEIIRDNSKAKGLWRIQDQYYANRAA